MGDLSVGHEPSEVTPIEEPELQPPVVEDSPPAPADEGSEPVTEAPGEGGAEAASGSGAEPDHSDSTTESVAPDKSPDKSPVAAVQPEKGPKPPRQHREPTSERSAFGKTLLYGGAGCLVIGAGMNFLLVNPAWSDVEAVREDAARIGREDADELTARFNARRLLTLGTLGVGVAGVGSGLLLSTSVLAVSPWGVTWWGQF